MPIKTEKEHIGKINNCCVKETQRLSPETMRLWVVKSVNYRIVTKHAVQNVVFHQHAVHISE